ncbi:MAG TPA: DinB family protein [Acidobacteriota bacterium]|nr:DinB family protein [Acidobacteriota bacterium]
MIAAIPYSEYVGSSDPHLVLASTPKHITQLVQNWDSKRWFMSYAPGSWNAAQIVLHLDHDEIGWSNRIRLTATLNGFVIQAYDGADWVKLESPVNPHIALQAYVSLRNLNMNLYEKIDPKQRTRTISHPECGDISIDWMIRMLAGHDLHHLKHLQMISEL